MTIKELIKERDLAKEEANKLMELGKSEERQLTEDEQKKFDELTESVRSLNSQVEQKVTEVAEAQEEAERKDQEEKEAAIKEALRQKLYDEGWQEVETSIRALSLTEAEAELEKARIDYDVAWEKYWEACREFEETRKKEEMKELIKEVLAETKERKLKADEKEAIERKEKEDKEAEERKLADEKEAEERHLEIKLEKENNMEKFNLSRALVQLASTKRTLEGVEAERSAALEAESKIGGSSGVLFSARDFNTTTQSENIDKNAVMPLSIIGKDPLWQRMGCRYLPSLRGTITLPHKSPRVAQAVAEKAALTHDTVTAEGVLMTPARIGDSQIWTKELLASENPALHEAMVQDMLIGLDRQITADVYTKALAGATEVAGVDLTRGGFLDLMAAAEVEYEGAFAAARSTFFQAADVVVDAGSGKFLADLTPSKDEGRTVGGVSFFYSSLFSDGTNQKYVVYGDFHNIVVGDWGMYEVIVDPYTGAKTGQVEITVNRIVKVAMHNPAAFVKSPDLDPAA